MNHDVQLCDYDRARKYLFINLFSAVGQGKEKGVGASSRLVPINTGSWSFLQVGACKFRELELPSGWFP